MNPTGTPPDDEILRRYRDAAGEAPPPELDMRILAAAHAATLADARPRLARPWWKAWLVPASVAAVAAIGLSLTLRVSQEEQRRAQELAAPAGRQAVEGGARAPAPPVPATPAAPAADADTVPPREAARADVPAEPPARSPSPTHEISPGPAPAAARAHPDAVLAPAREAASRAQSTELASPVAKPATGEEDGGIAKRERGAAKSLPDPSTGAAAVRDESAPAAPAPRADADDAPTPEQWLEHIRRLRAAGRLDAAAESLARFRARYPEFPLPEDLAPR